MRNALIQQKPKPLLKQESHTDCTNIEFLKCLHKLLRKQVKKAIILLILPVMLSLSCDGGLVDGILIGAGSGKALTEAQKLAEQKKTALIAEILTLREQLDSTTDPIEVAALQERLAGAEQKQQITQLTDSIATQVKAGLERDWGERPAQGGEGASNLTYLLGAAATIAASYAGKKTYEVAKKDRQIAAVKIAAKPDTERRVYESIGTA